MNLQDSVANLKGVGKKRVEMLKKTEYRNSGRSALFLSEKI